MSFRLRPWNSRGWLTSSAGVRANCIKNIKLLRQRRQYNTQTLRLHRIVEVHTLKFAMDSRVGIALKEKVMALRVGVKVFIPIYPHAGIACPAVRETAYSVWRTSV